MSILGTVVHQQKQLSRSHTVTQGIQKALRLGVYPVQVFKKEEKRLIQALSEKEFLHYRAGVGQLFHASRKIRGVTNWDIVGMQVIFAN